MTKEKYQKAIDDAIEKIGNDLKIKYSMFIHFDPLHKGAVANAFGEIYFKQNYATNLNYSFEIDESLGKIFTVGKVFGIGIDNVNSLNKIKELNDHISMNLGAMLVKRELESDIFKEAKFKSDGVLV